ncbi:hypothetical protein B0H14DRAFT_2610278 [Mycena olivaceomarginata]|nr:hypothetical protein B0H14DRAFT_2610278 [Mycena olivaceomarginata]
MSKQSTESSGFGHPLTASIAYLSHANQWCTPLFPFSVFLRSSHHAWFCGGVHVTTERVTVPFDKIKLFVGQYVQNGIQPTLSLGLVPDEKIVFSDYAARAAAGQVTRVPAIISNCANEMSALYPYPVDNLTAGPYKPAVLALDVTLWNTGTYPNLNPLRCLGAYHASDLPIAFGTYILLTDLSPTTPFEGADPQGGPQPIGWEPMNVRAPHGGTPIRFSADKVWKTNLAEVQHNMHWAAIYIIAKVEVKQ